MEQKICFVVVPFGRASIARSGASFNIDKVYRVAMKLAGGAAGFEPLRTDESAGSGLINERCD